MKSREWWYKRFSLGCILAMLGVLALPATSFAAREPEPSNPDYTVKAYYQNGRIWVTFKAPEAHKFQIKARNADSSVGGWIRLGKLRNPAKKKGAVVFSVPKALDGIPRLNICLKDLSSDMLICRMVIIP
jgi:hypothetical protein